MDEDLVARIESRRELAIISDESIFQNNGFPVGGKPTLEEVFSYVERKDILSYFEGVCLIYGDGSCSFYGLENERIIPPRGDLIKISSLELKGDLDEILKKVGEIVTDSEYLEDQVLEYAQIVGEIYPPTLFIVHPKARTWLEDTFNTSGIDYFFLEIENAPAGI